MNYKQLDGIAVVSIEDGAKLGQVDRVYLDPNAKQVVGFGVKPIGDRLDADAENLVDVDDIHALGADAMTLDNTNAVRGDRTRAMLEHLVDLDALHKRKVVTEGGTYIGEVAGVELDEASYRVTEIDVSPGLFKGNMRIPLEHVVNIGEMVIVDDVIVPANQEAVADDVSSDSGRHFVVEDDRPST